MRRFLAWFRNLFALLERIEKLMVNLDAITKAIADNAAAVSALITAFQALKANPADPTAQTAVDALTAQVQSTNAAVTAALGQ